jgi:hypothetical protein
VKARMAELGSEIFTGSSVEKWFIDRHRSEKSVPQATVVGPFT